jgi:hypothetical protein
VCKRFPNSIFAPEPYYQIEKMGMSRNQFNDAFTEYPEYPEYSEYPEYLCFNDVLHEKLRLPGY